MSEFSEARARSAEARLDEMARQRRAAEKRLLEQIAALEAENARLREALKFYATPINWRDKPSYVDLDQGKRARELVKPIQWWFATVDDNPIADPDNVTGLTGPFPTRGHAIAEQTRMGAHIADQ